jgi:hypothetical protein
MLMLLLVPMIPLLALAFLLGAERFEQGLGTPPRMD